LHKFKLAANLIAGIKNGSQIEINIINFLSTAKYGKKE
jgi:hypothetical protein